MPYQSKRKIRWWRGYELYILIGVFWYGVLSIWVDLYAGSHTTGNTVPGNPIVAASDVVLGHISWPDGYADVMAICEIGILAVVLVSIRRVLLARATAERDRADAEKQTRRN